MVEKRVRRLFGLNSRDNCATWAAANFDYAGGDGLLFHMTVSDSRLRFPHVVIVKGARAHPRGGVEFIEYVPKVRLSSIGWPPSKFDGVVERTKLNVK